MADNVNMFDSANLGIGKGRPGGYAVVAEFGAPLEDFLDMKKTLAEIVADTKNKAASLGYVDEDGVTVSTSTDSDDKQEWGGGTVGSPITSYTETVQVGFLESRDSVLKTVYGDDNVSTDGGVTTVRHNQNFGRPHLFAFDSVVSDTKVKRTIVPQGTINERDDVTYNNSDLVGYKPTIKCLQYGPWEGDTIRELIYDTTTGETQEVTKNQGADAGDPVE